MPELPDITLYLERLAPRVLGETLLGVRLASPFLLRSVAPPLAAAAGQRVVELRRLGKRLVFGLEGDLFLVLHLMVAGRLRWRPAGAAVPGKVGLAALPGKGGLAALPGKGGLAAFDFTSGNLLLTEFSSKKRASLQLVQGEAALANLDPGGLEVLAADFAAFQAALASENHTLKRALTDPTLFSGIGNAYSDEILHQAGLSPFKRTADLDPDETRRLYDATRATLTTWIDRLRAESPDFPDKVVANKPGMAVHGRYGLPCPRCGAPVQRILYAENEANYCPACQTAGRLLADRGLSRLLREDWPRTLADLEDRKRDQRARLGPAAAAPAPAPVQAPTGPKPPTAASPPPSKPRPKSRKPR